VLRTFLELVARSAENLMEIGPTIHSHTPIFFVTFIKYYIVLEKLEKILRIVSSNGLIIFGATSSQWMRNLFLACCLTNLKQK